MRYLVTRVKPREMVTDNFKNPYLKKMDLYYEKK